MWMERNSDHSESMYVTDYNRRLNNPDYAVSRVHHSVHMIPEVQRNRELGQKAAVPYIRISGLEIIL